MAGADSDRACRTLKTARSRSGRVAVVVPQQTTESLATPNLAFAATDFVPRLKDLVVEPWMIAFRVVVLQKLLDLSPEILDHFLLLAVDPAREDHHVQLPG